MNFEDYIEKIFDGNASWDDIDIVFDYYDKVKDDNWNDYLVRRVNQNDFWDKDELLDSKYEMFIEYFVEWLNKKFAH